MCCLLVIFSPALAGQPPQHFRVGWSTHAGWMPWAYAERAGIIDRWAKRFGIDITMARFDNYRESIRQYVDGRLDACAMTNLEAMSTSASSGIDSTAFLPTDYSNGAGGILLHGGKSLEDLRGAQVILAPQLVSHYLLERALNKAGLDESAVKLKPAANSSISVALTRRTKTAGVMWYQQLLQSRQQPGVSQVFDSSQIPGEIQDLLVARTETIARHPELAMALTGAWYETMWAIHRHDAQAEDAMCYMGSTANCDTNEFRRQLATIHLYTNPHEALRAWQTQEFDDITVHIRNFLYRQGAYGKQAQKPEDIGIAFPNGKVVGSHANIALRFSTAFTMLASQRLLLH